MPTAFVHATAITPKHQLEDDDVAIAGIYEVDLDYKTPSDGVADAALDAFHTKFGVNVLDDFSFVVRETADPTSAVIATNEKYEGYELSRHLNWVEKVDAPFQILATFQPQAWINDYATDVDGAQQVDVTREVLRLAKENLEDLHQLKDARDNTDALVANKLDDIGHKGPFTIWVENALRQAFDVSELGDITEEMVEDAERRAPAEPGKSPRPH